MRDSVGWPRSKPRCGGSRRWWHEGCPRGSCSGAVTEEVGRLLSVEYVHLCRYERDGTATSLAAFGRPDQILPAGTRWKLGGKNVTTLVFETGRSARIDDYGDASGPFAVGARERGCSVRKRALASLGAPTIARRSRTV